MFDQVVNALLTMHVQLKLYHWSTLSYSRHKATDELVAALYTLMDSFVEIYAGRYSRGKVSNDTAVIHLKNLSDADAVRLLQQYRVFLQTDLVKLLQSSDTDLLNIRDEMLGNVNQALYLFALK